MSKAMMQNEALINLLQAPFKKATETFEANLTLPENSDVFLLNHALVHKLLAVRYGIQLGKPIEFINGTCEDFIQTVQYPKEHIHLLASSDSFSAEFIDSQKTFLGIAQSIQSIIEANLDMIEKSYDSSPNYPEPL
tara:strand:- start:580 stop:987 length:408 start_codon:yes stop_codon:yes gene_type:complete